MSVDFESVKANLSLEDLAGVSSVGARGRKIPCPFHEDRTPSLHIYPDGRFKCYGCGAWGDGIDWLGYQQFGQAWKGAGHQLFHVLDMVAGWGVKPLSDAEITHRQRSRREHSEEERRAKADTRLHLRQMALDAHARLTPGTRQMWRDFGISDATIDGYRLGFDGERLTIPASYRNVVFGIKRRKLPSEASDTPKYLSVTGSVWGLFGADMLGQRPPYLIVCEDEKSALALVSKGAWAVASTGGAGFWKSQKAEWWARLFYPVPTLYFWRDTDTAGMGCAYDFRNRFPRAVVVDSSPHKDAADFIVDGGDWRDVVPIARRRVA